MPHARTLARGHSAQVACEVLNREDERGLVIAHRHGGVQGQQVAGERGPDVVGQPFDEAVGHLPNDDSSVDLVRSQIALDVDAAC